MNRDELKEFQGRPLSRREFVQRLTVAAGGAGLVTAGMSFLTPAQRAEAAEAAQDNMGKLPKVKLGTRMGDMMIGRVEISNDWNRALYGPGLAVGCNFVHKAGYWNSLPEDFKNLPRESYYTDITVDSTPDHPDDEDRAYNQVASSLDKNGLRYYDIFRAHFGWRSVDAFKTKTGTYKAFERLKREGKVKYFGVSQHGNPGDGGYANYPEMIQAEIDSGLIDHMQVFFSAATGPDVIEAFAKAHKAGIGLTAMKTFAHGSGKVRNDPQLQKDLGAEGMVGRTCVRYALSKTHDLTGGVPIFHACVSALHSMEMFEENMGAATMKTAMRDGFSGHFA